MPVSNMPVNMKAVIKIEKFPSGTKKEDIENGLIVPDEIIESEDNFLLPEEKVNEIMKEEI